MRTTDPELASAFVGALVQEGATVLQMHRHRQSLEELFVSEAKRADEREGVAR